LNSSFEGFSDGWNIPIHDISIGNSQRDAQLTDFELYIKNNFAVFATPKVVFNKTHDYLAIHDNPDKKIQENVELWKNRWKETCVSQESIPIVIMMQPVIGAGNKELTSVEQTKLNDGKHLFILSAFESLVSASTDLKPECKYVYDLTDIFDSHSEHIYASGAHLTDYGNDIVAQKMFEIILPIIDKKF